MTAVISREGYQPTFTLVSNRHNRQHLVIVSTFVCVPFFKHEITSSSIRCSTANTKSIMCICMYVSMQAIVNQHKMRQISGVAFALTVIS